jgi:nitrogen fixation protein NifU and related proteins
MLEDVYHEVLLEEAENPHNQGEMAHPDRVHRGINASCGDEVTVFLKLKPDGRIDALSWVGTGCVISQAAMSLLSDALVGKTKEQLLAMGLLDMLELLHFDSISPGRIKCCMLGLQSVQQALTTGYRYVPR